MRTYFIGAKSLPCETSSRFNGPKPSPRTTNNVHKLNHYFCCMNQQELKDFLEAKTAQYNQADFIRHDPVQIPHLFVKQQDIEIAGFFAATFAWGQRPTIIRKSTELMELMDMQPYAFIRHANEKELHRLQHFKHRTFNHIDLLYFIKGLRRIYNKYHTFGDYFTELYSSSQNMAQCISLFKADFFSMPHHGRTEKHIADPLKGSTAKRLNMYLRWMVRKDDFGVDFGLWNIIPASALYLPLDVHSARIARQLGLLKRTTNDWKAVAEVTANLRKLDPADPVKYDYALFGTGVFEDF